MIDFMIPTILFNLIFLSFILSFFFFFFLILFKEFYLKVKLEFFRGEKTLGNIIKRTWIEIGTYS